jgi:hypothetical protein
VPLQGFATVTLPGAGTPSLQFLGDFHWFSHPRAVSHNTRTLELLGCCPWIPGHRPPKDWERLPGLALPFLHSLFPWSLSDGPSASSTVAGAWAEWGPWTACSVSCGGGHQSRQRSCVDPPPKNGGAPCPGPSHEKAPCNLQLCPGDTGKGKLAGRDL